MAEERSEITEFSDQDSGKRNGSLPSEHVSDVWIELKKERIAESSSFNSTLINKNRPGQPGVEEDRFEQVSLKDEDVFVLDSQGNLEPLLVSGSDNVSSASESLMGKDVAELGGAVTSYMHEHTRGSSGCENLSDQEIKASLSSEKNYIGMGLTRVSTLSSPFAPPLTSKIKSNMPNMSPELMHLVNSAIMDDPEGLKKLRDFVSENKMEGVNIAFSTVDALLVTMGGGECLDDGGSSPPNVMMNSRAAIVAAELIPWLPWQGGPDGQMSPRTIMVKGLLAILKACTRNRSMCSTSGLLGVLLWSVGEIFTQELGSTKQILWDHTPLCHCMHVLGSHSLNVVDLDKWLQLIKRTIQTSWSMDLMLALEKAMGGMETRGPSCTFEFDGESSGLLGPGESRWPFTTGYSFVTWIYVESFADTLNTATAAAAIAAAAAAKSGKSSPMSAAAAASALAGEGTAHMPRLFSFLSADNQGFEAYFHAQFLVVESGTGKGKKASLHFTYAFKPNCWYFIGLEHNCKQSLIGKAESELRLYIDGNLYESRPFEFPRISKPLAFCCIGTNPPPTIAGLQRRRRQCPLFAEMGPIYIFKEPIGQDRMSRLAARGGDILPSFGDGAGLPWLATNDHMRDLAVENFLLDADIGGSLHLLYHPNLLSGRFCPDASPSGQAGVHRRPAEVLGQVHVASRIRPAESLWALAHGGPMSLLPLAVSDVQNDSLEPQPGDLTLSLATSSLSASIFRTMSMAILHPGNSEELCRVQGPEVLSVILRYLLRTLSASNLEQNGVRNEELVAAIVSLCQSERSDHLLKVQLFRTLLLNLKLWSLCNYGLQKKLLSSLADMVFTESEAMRDANAVQMLLDGCRRCYWIVREMDSIDTFSLGEASRPVGEINSLVDELLVIIELLVGAASPLLAVEDVRCLIGFMVDCPQPNQVARVLHLMFRLVVQPNTSRAHTFAESFISCGGIETLLVLLQREAKSGDFSLAEISSEKDDGNESVLISTHQIIECSERSDDDHVETLGVKECLPHEEGSRMNSLSSGDNSVTLLSSTNIGRTLSSSESQFMRNLGGISFSINANSARDNVYNVDSGDGILVGIIHLLGALVTSGHLKFNSKVGSWQPPNNILNNMLPVEEVAVFSDKVSLVHFALQRAFKAAPRRLMTGNVYMALLGAVVNASSTEEGLNFYDSGQRFEHVQLLLVLLRSLPYASRSFQARAIQDLLFLACSHQENRSNLTSMEEWPDWILEVLIANYEMGPPKCSDGVSITDLEDLIHNFLIIMLEYSMRQKDGWKDVEATIHCAEWLSMIGGSSTGDQRLRREESLPVFKRRLLGSLLDFSARELRVQTQIIAAAAAVVAAEGLSPENAKAETESAAQLSVALAENALVILMLVEDHLRLQSQLFCASFPFTGSGSPAFSGRRSASLSRIASDSLDSAGMRRLSLSSDSGFLSLDVLASMADANGQISAAVMERLTAAAAAEPYEHVQCAFVSYGSCTLDLAEGWKYRSRMWFGVGISPNTTVFGGGGSGWEHWNSCLEKDSNGFWIELPLLKKSVAMLQALLLDELGLGGGLGIGGGSGTGMGGMATLYQLLDSDQPFLCMLRMVLASMREEDNGEEGILRRNVSITEGISDSLVHAGKTLSLDNSSSLSDRKPRSALLWSVLAPVLNMPISESKRQRVLAALSIFYAEVWNAVGKDRKPLRKQYLEAILPPFIAMLRRWRPLLAGIHEFTSPDGENPFVVDTHALTADSLPLESALSLITPAWAAAFASPPAAMALSMVAAGAAGNETVKLARSNQLRRDSSLVERKTAKLHAFGSFQKPSDTPNIFPANPKDKAAAKAAALAAARDLERNAKIGSGRGLSAVAMATSAQRRSKSDLERVRRWNVSDAMGFAWTECLRSMDTNSVSAKDFSPLAHKYVAVLVASFALARNMQRLEMDRRMEVDAIDKHLACTGIRSWRKLIHCLIETKCLYGAFEDRLCNPERVFWKLDLLEGSLRMRRCLRRNYRGSDHLGAAANYEDDRLQAKCDEDNEISQKNALEASFRAVLPSASIMMAESVSLEANEEDEQTDSEHDNVLDEAIGMEWSVENQNQISGASDQPLRDSVDERQIKAVNGQNFDQITEISLGYVPSESDERIILELSSLIVRPLRVIRGTFQITTKRINFIVEKPSNDNSTENELYSSTSRGEMERDRSWLISSLHQIFSRRYLLRRSALELFMVDRSNYFFDFGSTEGRKNAYRAIVQVQPRHLNNIYLATQRPEQLLKRTQLMERWARWEISNFEYLMQLNTLAGRSYNDITQYPVFPWVLSDYSSKNLDLKDPSSYRDLSKPIGALNPDRLVKFQERYSSFDDPIIPKFHYGSHYSSAGTVLYYLYRMEPFTTLSIQLQGGKFDHADRMFSDIGGTWNSVLEDMSDVKELVPELFYLPEVLTNVNSIDFGITQLGGKLDSVKLPPWADNPVDFIHKHNQALESAYVSENLHEWIDLIFGYKQRGKEAILANNVFFYITYEGTVDIDKISDPAQQRATQDQIAYFGQTPSQLLTIPHVKRWPLEDVLHLQTIFRNPNEVRPYVVPNPERCNLPAAAIFASQDCVIVVDENAPAAHVALHKWQPNTPDGRGTPFLFQHGKTVASSTSGAFIRMFKGQAGSSLEEWQFPRALAFAASGIQGSSIVAVTCDREIITGGHADNSVKLISSDGAKTIESATAHLAPVTCLSLSPDCSFLVTGSRDTTVILWRIRKATLLQSSSMSEISDTSVTRTSTSSPAASGNNFVEIRMRRIEGPVHVLRGHLQEVTSCCVNADVGIVVSSSVSSGVLVHSVRRGRLIRKLDTVEAHAVCISSSGIILTWNKLEQKLRTFTVNGVPVASAVLSPFLGNLSCMEVSLDGESVLIGMNSCSVERPAESSNSNMASKPENYENNDLTSVLHEENMNRLTAPAPSICFLSLHTLEIFHILELGESQDIASLALNADNTNLLVSTADKQLIIFTDPALSLKVVDHMLRLGWEGDGLSPLIR